MRLASEPLPVVTASADWRPPPRDDIDTLFKVWPCPVCGEMSDYAFHYPFERDMIAFRCLKCGLLEVKGK